MDLPPPVWQVPRIAPGGGRDSAIPWKLLPALPPLLLADGSAPASQATAVRLAWDGALLHVRCECADRDAWGTFTHRDDPLYEEDCVEVFLAPGAADPAAYFELEVSPLGTLLDARIENPHGRRDTLRADFAWDCPGLRWAAGRMGRGEDWWAELAIPLAALAPGGELPRVWRANVYRIERPRGGEAELSCWSPTLTSPPDFHKPARFGRLEMA
jgi:hypothetical protein